VNDVLPPGLVHALSDDVQPSAHTRAAYEMVVALATALHRCGTASHDLEEQMVEVTRALGVSAQFFATPTALVIQLGHGPSSETRLIRVDPATTDLRRTVRVAEVVQALLGGHRNAGQALHQLHEIDRAPPVHRRAVKVLAFALAGAGAARLFGGGLGDVLASTLVGTVVGGLTVLAPKLKSSVTRLFEPIASFLAAVLATALGMLVSPVEPSVVTLAALVVLLPGLSLTQAMSELAVRNLASGTARLMGAATVLLTIGFGVALGRGLATPIVDAVDVVVPTVLQVARFGPTGSLPAWTAWLGVAVLAASLVIVLSGEWRDIPLVLVALSFATWGGRVGAVTLGPQLGPSVAALCLGLAANASGRLGYRPPAVVLIPGLLLLVPGSLGLRSVDLMMSDEFVQGMEAAFSTAVTAVSLVAGLLLANAALPPAGSPSERHAPSPAFRRLTRLVRPPGWTRPS